MSECGSGKVGHPSRSTARRAAVAVAIKRTHDRPRVYACPDCHRWHLTSVRRSRTPRRGRRVEELREPRPASAAEVDAWFAAHRKEQPADGAALAS
jgi:hypothetical protein